MKPEKDPKSIFIVVVLTLILGWVGVEVFSAINAGRDSSNQLKNAADEIRRSHERNQQ